MCHVFSRQRYSIIFMRGLLLVVGMGDIFDTADTVGHHFIGKMVVPLGGTLAV